MNRVDLRIRLGIGTLGLIFLCIGLGTAAHFSGGDLNIATAMVLITTGLLGIGFAWLFGGSDSQGCLGCYAMLAIPLAIYLITFAPRDTVYCTVDYFQRSLGSKIKMDMHAEIEPSKLGKNARGTLVVSLHNNMSQSIETEDIVLGLPNKFFDGYIIDYPTVPPHKSKADGLLGVLPSITFAGILIAPSQTMTLTIPLIGNIAGDYSGEVRLNTNLSNNRPYRK